MAFTLPLLPYSPEALEPVIDAETMRLHHDKHHQTYVDNLNKAVDADSALQGKDILQLIRHVSTAPKAVRNNGGGHFNHTLFWSLMAAPGRGGQPSGALKEQIDRDFGSVEAMQEQFNAAGAGQFGSGWAWLIWSGGKLQITSTPNQDNPLMDVAETKGDIILGNDVWEHAYYLKHQNRRADYLKGWWQVVNWSEAGRLFDRVRV
ncbi:MAG: superoxide dismutase [Sphingomonadaceae bacterium]|nr:superoxide dismutase [Sphingomonadaceae bacterium]